MREGLAVPGRSPDVRRPDRVAAVQVVLDGRTEAGGGLPLRPAVGHDDAWKSLPLARPGGGVEEGRDLEAVEGAVAHQFGLDEEFPGDAGRRGACDLTDGSAGEIEQPDVGVSGRTGDGQREPLPVPREDHVVDLFPRYLRERSILPGDRVEEMEGVIAVFVHNHSELPAVAR